jgi:hypothetical protein
MKMAKVFYSSGPQHMPGWYYQIDMATPVGPFDTKQAAVDTAQTTGGINYPQTRMTNHPHRSRGPYLAEIGGSSWRQGPQAEFTTIRAARAWAEEYSDTADYCVIMDRYGAVVARHQRDPNGNGRSWFRATP